MNLNQPILAAPFFSRTNCNSVLSHFVWSFLFKRFSKFLFLLYVFLKIKKEGFVKLYFLTTRAKSRPVYTTHKHAARASKNHTFCHDFTGTGVRGVFVLVGVVIVCGCSCWFVCLFAICVCGFYSFSIWQPSHLTATTARLTARIVAAAEGWVGW